MTPQFRRIAFWGILCVLLAGGLVYAFMPQPVPVDFATVTRGELLVTVEDEGKTRVREVYVVSAPLPGRAMRITKKAGDPVIAGETVLATIEPGNPTLLDIRSRTQAEALAKGAEAALSLARADQERAHAELDFALEELARARQLAARQTVSQSALDRAILEAKVRRAALTTAEAAGRVREFELKNARASLIEAGPDDARDAASGGCCVNVRAPVDGRILRVLHESAGTVAAGDPLVEVGDPAELEIVADLLSTDAVRVREGQPVFIEDWGGDGALQGVVRRVEPTGFTKFSALGIEEQRVTTIIDFTGPPEAFQRMGHGYRVEVRIVVWQGNNVLRVPVGALFREGAEWAVFVESDGIARKRIIRIGTSNALYTEILDGLAEGDRVLLHPSDRILDGTMVMGRNGA
ncbi:MAG: HlyD family efflux transporter periplasmic adaptor subunit [Proteobacteria bacterium]|nr:HlyD family efflux transporter periplasmic adaptor subunit [Pseudomonadota bacterium]